jgi:hypothetical protein
MARMYAISCGIHLISYTNSIKSKIFLMFIFVCGIGSQSNRWNQKIFSSNLPEKSHVKPLDPAKSAQPTENTIDKTSHQVAY